MNHAEESIERLLGGLRGAEPPAGMQRRIVEAMEAGGADPSLSPWRIRRRLACAFVLAALWIVTVKVSRRQPAPERLGRNADLRQTAERQEPAALPRRAKKRLHAEHTLVASYPAPPLPLTEQEKLLLRLAHRRDADDMAVLNREVQAAQTAKATAQFQQFFGMNAKEMRSQIE